MRRVSIDMNLMKEQVELIDLLSDTASEDDAELLDGIAGFLDQIVNGEIQCFYKEHNGTTE